jgi:type I restriction enzyme, S subunit
LTAGWSTVPMGELCSIQSGKSDTKDATANGSYAFFDRSKTIKRSSRFLRDCETLIIPGEGTEFLPRHFNGKFDLHQRAYALFDFSPKLDVRSLYHYLHHAADYFPRVAVGATVKSLRLRHFEELPVRLIERSEQQRIVAILDEAFAGIATAKANAEKNLQNALALVSTGYQAITEAYDSSRWPSVPVTSLAASHKGSVRTGPFGSQLLHSEFVDEGIAVLDIDNAVTNEFRWDRRRYITAEKYRQLSRYRVLPGDVLITIMGTCGRCAVVPEDIPEAINTKHLCCITLERRKCLPEFLHIYFLYDVLAKGYLNAQAKGSIMAGLNMGIILELPVRLPPLQQQAEIVERFSSLRAECLRLESIYQQKLAALDELKKSLLHQAFSGHL